MDRPWMKDRKVVLEAKAEKIVVGWYKSIRVWDTVTKTYSPIYRYSHEYRPQGVWTPMVKGQWNYGEDAKPDAVEEYYYRRKEDIEDEYPERALTTIRFELLPDQKVRIVMVQNNIVFRGFGAPRSVNENKALTTITYHGKTGQSFLYYRGFDRKVKFVNISNFMRNGTENYLTGYQLPLFYGMENSGFWDWDVLRKAMKQIFRHLGIKNMDPDELPSPYMLATLNRIKDVNLCFVLGRSMDTYSVNPVQTRPEDYGIACMQYRQTLYKAWIKGGMQDLLFGEIPLDMVSKDWGLRMLSCTWIHDLEDRCPRDEYHFIGAVCAFLLFKDIDTAEKYLKTPGNRWLREKHMRETIQQMYYVDDARMPLLYEREVQTLYQELLGDEYTDAKFLRLLHHKALRWSLWGVDSALRKYLSLRQYEEVPPFRLDKLDSLTEYCINRLRVLEKPEIATSFDDEREELPF